VAVKPTYGTVSRYGLVAFASSLDQIGPLTKTVRDNAMIMNVIAGHDGRDATSIKREYGDFTAEIGKDVKGLKIGIPKEFFGEGISSSVKESVLAAAEKYEKMGADVTWVSMPSIENALSAYYVISSAEASSNLARFDGVRYGVRANDFEDIDELYKKSRSQGFGAEVKRRIMQGNYVLSSGFYDAYYRKAKKVQGLLVKEYEDALKECDIIVMPTTIGVAYKIGSKPSDPVETYKEDIFTVTANIAGLPSLSIPYGYGEENLPLGIQLMAGKFNEKEIYKFAKFIESKKGE
jgi:aspartyl-tRNA(Asn)/glutamyl-tRNA(Gln) amidotransferase subunit A